MLFVSGAVWLVAQHGGRGFRCGTGVETCALQPCERSVSVLSAWAVGPVVTSHMWLMSPGSVATETEDLEV